MHGVKNRDILIDMSPPTSGHMHPTLDDRDYPLRHTPCLEDVGGVGLKKEYSMKKKLVIRRDLLKTLNDRKLQNVLGGGSAKNSLVSFCRNTL